MSDEKALNKESVDYFNSEVDKLRKELKKQKEEAAKKKIDQMSAMYGMDHNRLKEWADAMTDFKWSASFEPMLTTPEDLVEKRDRLFSDLENIKTEIKKVQEEMEFVDALPFTAGDAAFNKDHGNVLINGVILNRQDLSNSSYSVTVRNGGRINLLISDVVPITEATKILYGKNKRK